MARRHDHDAAGPADLLAAKAALRDEVWSAMSVKGIGRFPAPSNRIPNFVGAEAAADQLAESTEWQRASTVKSCIFVYSDATRSSCRNPISRGRC